MPLERTGATAPGTAIPDASTPAPAPAFPLRALVVDDEAIAREGLERILATTPGVTVLPGCRNGRDAIAAVRAHAPDVVFLDIEMPGLDGLGVARLLGEEAVPVIVFVTAYSSYAVDAFELEASDYLVKPFTDARVEACVARVRRLRSGREEQRRGAQLADLVTSWARRQEHAEERDPDEPQVSRAAAQEYATRLLVPHGLRTIVVPVELIDWITADDDYVVLHSRGKTHLLRGTLGAIAAQLDPASFVRTHRSVLVSISRITELRRERDGSASVVLGDGSRLPVGRRRYDEVRRALASAPPLTPPPAL